MNKKLRKSLYLLTIIAVLTMSFMPTYTVFADGGAGEDPPPAEPPAEEPVEEPTAEPLIEETTAEVPPEEVAEVSTEETPAEETVSVPEILEQVPEGTDLVVINEEGDSEPLASEAAAEILVEGDPIWCPSGVAPGDPSCSSSHVSFDSLITDLTGGSFSGDGVIWVEHNYDATQDTGPIVFDGSSLTNLTDITVMGGWNGAADSTSSLDDSLTFTNWEYGVSIYNLDFQTANGAEGSLVIETEGDILLDNITIDDNQLGPGASLDTCFNTGAGCVGTGNVTVTDSVFTNNDEAGLEVISTADVTINSVTTDGNNWDGITINGQLMPDAHVTVKDTTATNNGFNGVEVTNIGGNVTMKGITANMNDWDGIGISTTRGDVYLANITANESAVSDGIDLENIDGNVTLSSITANLNSQSGIEITNVDGSTKLYCVTTNENVNFDGIFIQTDNGVVLKCSQSNDNGGDGVQINLAPNAQLLSFTATGNGGTDINIDTNVTAVTEKQVDCSGKKKESTGVKDPWTKLHCLPGEIKVSLYDTYGDKVEFDNLCGYDAGVFDPESWILPEEIPGGGEEYILSLQEKMLEEIPGLEAITKYGLPGIIAQVLDELPYLLPDGFSYASAFFTAVIDETEELVDPLPEEAGLTVRFRVPEWLDPQEQLAILWWDGAEWVDMGGEYSEDGYYFQVTTEETGVFVLATFEAEE